MADDIEPVIACSLGGGGQAERFQQWHELLGSSDVSREPLAIHAAISSDKAAELAELARDEQECCPFLGFPGGLSRSHPGSNRHRAQRSGGGVP